MIKKIICIGVVIVMLVALVMLVVIATYEPAPEKKGDFYTLQEAYDQGLISLDDLKSIAYYQNGGSEDDNFLPMPKNPEVLSEKTEKAIKETRAYELSIISPISEIKAKDIIVLNYYGTYNNCVAVMLDRDNPHFGVVREVTIDGVLFHYNNSNSIIIWIEL